MILSLDAHWPENGKPYVRIVQLTLVHHLQSLTPMDQDYPVDVTGLVIIN
jgi:hypothetical protein